MTREHVLQRIKQSHNVLLRTGHSSFISAAYCSPEYEGMVRGTPRANISVHVLSSFDLDDWRNN